MINIKDDSLYWLKSNGLENYKKAYAEKRTYSLVAYPINKGDKYYYRSYKYSVEPKNLMTLQQCKDYIETLNEFLDDYIIYDFINKKVIKLEV